MRIYQHNGSSFEELVEEKYSENTTAATFSKDKTYLAVTTSSETFVYKNATSGSLNLESALPSGKWFNLFSDNNKYLATAQDG